MTEERRFSTSLRSYARTAIEKMGKADIVIGIPAYYSESTILHVLETITKGLERYYPDQRALILVADGGSTDDTREVVRDLTPSSFNIEQLALIYRGLPGKGSALRSIFETARFLKPSAVAIFDSDLVSITPEWVTSLIEPVRAGFDFVAPDYSRHKLDGTITNTIAYNLTRALYGCRIRQPIGGDFGLSLGLVRHYLDQDDIWETDVARFGIDIWMTTTAAVNGFKLCQAKLGAKIHGHKDPAADLGPMFRQVVGTLFQLMEIHTDHWLKTTHSYAVPSQGTAPAEDPEALSLDCDRLLEYFKIGFWNFGEVWKQLIEEQDYATVNSLAHSAQPDDLRLPVEAWVRIVYRYALAFHTTPRQRFKVLDTMLPLYYARVASLANEVRNLDQVQAEQFFEDQALIFENMKPYLVNLWERSM